MVLIKRLFQYREDQYIEGDLVTAITDGGEAMNDVTINSITART
jgi:hypothetical protein